MLASEFSVEQKRVYAEWDTAWRKIVALKKKYHPREVPMELRGQLENDVVEAAKKLKMVCRMRVEK